MILQTDQHFLSITTKGSMVAIEARIKIETKRLIRKEFDKSAFDHQALATIALAKKLGFNDLAQEMEDDYSLNLEVPKKERNAA